jgi:GcrA cell cycle regulator
MRSTGHNRSLVPKQRKSRARSPTTSNSKASAARRFQGGDVAGTQPTPQDALVVVDGGLGKSFMDLEPGDCRFPIGEPGAPDFYFCAGQQTDGSYCLGHARIAYQHHQARRS